jgi:hypothetical protein
MSPKNIDIIFIPAKIGLIFGMFELGAVWKILSFGRCPRKIKEKY